MPIPYSQYYHYFLLPLDNVLSVYASSFSGSQHLSGFKPAISLGSKIDEYVSSLTKTDSQILIEPQVHKLITEYGYMEECCIQLRDKLDCAFIIRHLYRTKKIQLLIENQTSNSFSYARYYGVPESLLLDLKNEISSFKRVLDNISTHNNSPYFREQVYKPVLNAIRKYYLVFDIKLYDTPLSEQAKEVAFEGGMRIGCFILFCLIFWLIAKVMCS